jgi:hypothetical protein
VLLKATKEVRVVELNSMYFGYVLKFIIKQIGGKYRIW